MTYVWGYQQHFHSAMNLAATQVFAPLDSRLHPRCLLFAVPLVNGIPVAAWTAPSTPLDVPQEESPSLRELAVRFRALSGRQETKPELRATEVQARERISAIMSTAYPSATAVERLFTWPVIVNNHLVWLILQLDAATMAKHYTLKKSADDWHFVPRSLIDSAFYQFSQEVQAALRDPDLGFWHFDRRIGDIRRMAGDVLMHTPKNVSRPEGPGLFDACNAISTLMYEGASVAGALVIANREHPSVSRSILFGKQIALSAYRGVRKLLEVCGRSDASLLTDGASVYGLGRIVDYKEENENLFTVSFVSHATWDLLHAGKTLMRVHYGVPQLPKQLIDEEEFSRVLTRAFPDIVESKVAAALTLARAASHQRHGTMLVVSSKAEGEAKRLGAQSTTVEPFAMDGETLKLVSSIDGAVLIDQDCVCHAIGVILDGKATERGDPSRGARFNSAIRYVEGHGEGCVAIVISEDGMVNLVSPAPASS